MTTTKQKVSFSQLELMDNWRASLTRLLREKADLQRQIKAGVNQSHLDHQRKRIKEARAFSFECETAVRRTVLAQAEEDV